MYRIRLHGRGGQGIKTASRILGTALFNAGFEVQDAPRYGAERRGAPIFAYVRAGMEAIHERGAIRHPDLVVVIDETLMQVPSAGVLEGITEHTVLLIHSSDDPGRWSERFDIPGPVLPLPDLDGAQSREALPFIAVASAGAAARLVGKVSRKALEDAVREELGHLEPRILEENLALALRGYAGMEAHSGAVTEAAPNTAPPPSPDWIDLPLEDAFHASPTIYHPATSHLSKTGLWRTERPVIDPERCKHCWWVCGTSCPDGAISANGSGVPHIDYDHCKGCMICLAQCPSHAIEAVLEQALTDSGEGGQAR